MIERKTGLLYEILLRGNFDDAARLGHFKGGHLIEAEAVVDTDTGEVVSYKHGNPVPISEARARQYFGEQFASFNAGFDAMRARNAQLESDLNAARSEAGELTTQLKATIDNLAAANAQIAGLVMEIESKDAQLAAASAELSAAATELSHLTSELAKALESKEDASSPSP